MTGIIIVAEVLYTLQVDDHSFVPSSCCKLRPGWCNRCWCSPSVDRRPLSRRPRGERSGQRWSGRGNGPRRRKRTACRPTFRTEPEIQIMFCLQFKINLIFQMDIRHSWERDGFRGVRQTTGLRIDIISSDIFFVNKCKCLSLIFVALCYLSW